MNSEQPDEPGQDRSSADVIQYQFDATNPLGGTSIIRFEGELKRQLLEHYRSTYSQLGRYSSDSHAVSKQTGKSLAYAAAGTGVIGLANATSMIMYMPTVPAHWLTPMADGGLSTMIHGARGIVAHGSFMPVPLAASVVPPLAAMQVMQSAMIMSEFKKLQSKLEDIERRLTSLLMRDLAADIGVLDASMSLLEELHEQYELSGMFSVDALTRLSQVEFNIVALLGKYTQLTDTNSLDPYAKKEEVDESILNMRQRLLFSFLQLRAAHLRVFVNMQENPAYVERSMAKFCEIASSNIERWQKLLHGSEEIAERELESQSLSLFGSRKEPPKEIKHGDAFIRTLQAEKELLEEFTPLITRIEDFLTEARKPETEKKNEQILVYGRDESGNEFSFYTSELPSMLRS